MSVSPTIYAPALADSAEPVQYGWRAVRRELPDGAEVFDEVPLTLEDVLYPEEGDQVMHSNLHQRIVRYLTNALEAHFRHDPQVLVLDDMRIAWDDPALRPNSPDVVVITGAAERRIWSTFSVGEEQAHPALIIEVTSPETRGIDLVTKVDIYAEAGVPLYLIIDVHRRRGVEQLRLLGYRLTLRGYEQLAPDERGWLWIEPAGLWIGLADMQAYLYDQRGERIGEYAELVDALAQTAARADEAQARAQEAQARADEAQARADEAQARADEAQARAQEELEARRAAEQRAAELEARLRDLERTLQSRKPTEDA